MARKKSYKNIVIFIKSSFNNNLVSISDTNGDVIWQGSSGSLGFKGAKQSSPYAAQCVMNAAIKAASSFNAQSAEIKVRGPGFGRESALRALCNADFAIVSIEDRTPIPFNGCRLPKPRRL